jgi:cytochrome b561
MLLKDTVEGYGLVSRLFHWLMALVFFALFVLGWWMVGLDYYSPYYHSAPDLHRSAGILLLIALLFRIIWRTINIKPADPELSPLERRAAHAVHLAFYPLLLLLMISGYFISTPDGRPIDVFGLFKVPSLVQEKGLSDTAGLAHRWLAYAALALAGLHTVAALKHHFADRNKVLTRMWSGPQKPAEQNSKKR